MRWRDRMAEGRASCVATGQRVGDGECRKVTAERQSPYRLVVRTSRCGRDNPGSTPGEDIAACRPLATAGCTGLHEVMSEHTATLA